MTGGRARHTIMRAFLLLLAAGCATGASSYGSVSFKSFSNAGARPASFSVGKGEVVGSGLDLREDQGCIRGSWGRIPLDFCRDDKGAGSAQHWSGTSGQFAVTPSADSVAVRGELILDTLRIVSMDQDVRIGQGKQWDELRRHPALLAVAATTADLVAIGLRR